MTRVVPGGSVVMGGTFFEWHIACETHNLR